MTTVLRALRLLTMTTWVGGLLFFAFTLAPAAFHTLPVHQAGFLVGATLPILHRTGMVCGVLFLVATGFSRPRSVAQSTLVVLMLALTFYIQARILPAMERDRARAGGDITAATGNDPARIDFDKLHKQSEQVEGVVLILGIAVVCLLAVDPKPDTV